MSKNLEQKKNIAKVVLFLHTILALSFGVLVISFVVFSEFWLLILPVLFGYGLLWLYWLEIGKTDAQSPIRWAASVLFHLGALIVLPLFWLLGLMLAVTTTNMGVGLQLIEIALISAILIHFVVLIASVWAWFISRAILRK